MSAALKGRMAVSQRSESEPPLAVQEVAFVVDHDKVVPCPVVKLGEAAVNEPLDAPEPGRIYHIEGGPPRCARASWPGIRQRISVSTRCIDDAGEGAGAGHGHRAGLRRSRRPAACRE
jgi:hypothetical protein